MLKQKYFLTDFFILSAEKQPIKSSWRKIEWLQKTALTLRDLGQLWAYCKLIDPEEAFLFTSMNLGSLDKLLNIFLREDLLDFGKGKVTKKMKVGIWDISSNAPDMFSLIPKL